MTDIEQHSSDSTPLPSNEQVLHILKQKHEMIKDAWRNIKDVEEGCTQTDWIFEHYCTVLDHAQRVFHDDFDKLLKEAVDMGREEYFTNDS
jgi:hypothetical protein